MGTTTPNIGIYIPVTFETGYDQAFEEGMINVDQHDHSGGPNKGLPITSAGLSPFSVTYDKLNTNVADPTTGIGTSGTLLNQLVILGLLKNIFQLTPTTGFITKDGVNANCVTFQNSASITWTNPDGAAGNPSAVVNIAGISPIPVANGGTGLTSLTPFAIMLGGTTSTNPMQQVATLGNAGDLLVSQGAAMSPTFNSPVSLGQIGTATVTLTAAQFNALNATPIQILAAPGAGKVVIPVTITARTTLVTNFSGGGTVSLGYQSTASPIMASFNAANFQTLADSYYFANQNMTFGVPVAQTQNQPIYITSSGTSTSGTGSTVTFTLNYIVLTL
jgi:hypothetical protein